MVYWILSILGLLLVISPFALGYSTDTNAMWSSIVLGAVIALVSGYKALARDKGIWEDVIAVIAGVVAIAIPFVLGFSSIAVALWTFVVMGILVVLLSGYDIYARRMETT
ncbi:MAG: SPW repeat protein [Chloroflexales bacterium]|nr:SPW repeat protein [Chloroflexales bacterium]